VSISTLAWEYPRGYDVHEHAHGSDQLIYAIRGVMQVSAGSGVWLIPPQFGIWIPAGTFHSIHMPGAVSMRTLYMRRGLAARVPAAGAVIHIAPLLRELIVEAVRIGELRTRNRLHCALRDVLASQLEAAPPMPISLTLPQDTRARVIADRVMSQPGERETFATLCGRAGASVRTMQRVFRRETGTDFEFWRRQVRLMKAIELLVAGEPVQEVAYSLGYRQPTAFVEMFRGILGTTPGAWVKTLPG
jgi:AraC-like DNA-binding protein